MDTPKDTGKGTRRRTTTKSKEVVESIETISAKAKALAEAGKPDIPTDLRSAADDREDLMAEKEIASRLEMGEDVIRCKACGVIPKGTCPYGENYPGAPCQSQE